MISGCRFWQSQKPRISIGQICNPAVLGPCTCTTTPAANPCPSSTRQLGGLIPGHGVYACQGARLRGYAGPRTTESDRFDMLRRSFFMRFNMRHDFLQLQISPMLRGSAGMVRITCPGPFFSSMHVLVVREVHTNCPIVHVASTNDCRGFTASSVQKYHEFAKVPNLLPPAESSVSSWDFSTTQPRGLRLCVVWLIQGTCKKTSIWHQKGLFQSRLSL